MNKIIKKYDENAGEGQWVYSKIEFIKNMLTIINVL